MKNSKHYINGKSILITGGTGSFGKKFIEIILKKFKPRKIIVFSRDEFKQSELRNKYLNNEKNILRFYLGDIRDKDRLRFALKDVDIVVHAAALKQVPALEYNPFEAVKTNIIGSQNLIDACIENKVEKIIALSTDKAAAPYNLYGATKLVSDKLFVNSNFYRGKMKYSASVVRYGNVFASRGSVFEVIMKLDKTQKISITDPEMTRFSIEIEAGVNFVIQCIKRMWGGEIFIPKLQSYKVKDIIKAVGVSKDKIQIIGSRPGEKKHEEMISKDNGKDTVDFDDYYVILPSSRIWDENKFIKNSHSKKGVKCKESFSYVSNKNEFLKVNDLKKLIKKYNNEI